MGICHASTPASALARPTPCTAPTPRPSPIETATHPSLGSACEPTGNLHSRKSEAVMKLPPTLTVQRLTICMVTQHPRLARSPQLTGQIFHRPPPGTRGKGSPIPMTGIETCYPPDVAEPLLPPRIGPEVHKGGGFMTASAPPPTGDPYHPKLRPPGQPLGRRPPVPRPDQPAAKHGRAQAAPEHRHGLFSAATRSGAPSSHGTPAKARNPGCPTLQRHT